jgi:protein tyrosine phosphatase (PTP) superfamily phosphohydrolase (DUF442 family)
VDYSSGEVVMMSKLLRSILWGVVIVGLVPGCQGTNRQQRVPAAPGPTFVPGGQPVFPAPSGGGAAPAGIQVPPPPAPVSPGANVNPGTALPPSGSQLPPAPAPISPGPSRYAPEQGAQDRWEPGPGTVKPGTVKLLPPEPAISESAKTPLPKIFETKEPELAKKPPSAFPAGIPDFNPLKEGVATGLRPSLDGLDWLQANGYHTVLHVRKPGEDDSADRKQVENRKITYLSVEVSPQTLDKKTVDKFSGFVADKIAYPLFVYDRDGSLAGGLWYLFFRTVEQNSDDVARIRAGSVGFREDRDDNHRSMWLAVQNYLKRP